MRPTAYLFKYIAMPSGPLHKNLPAIPLGSKLLAMPQWSLAPIDLSVMGAQWLSDRVLDSRPRGCTFVPHRRHCVVSLSKTH